MTFDGIKVQHGSLDAGAADVMKAAKDIESRLDQLENELNPLKSDWNGNAKMAYDQAKAKWDQAMQEMTLLLQQASQGVDASNQEYKAADARAAPTASEHHPSVRGRSSLRGRRPRAIFGGARWPRLLRVRCADRAGGRSTSTVRGKHQ